MKIANMALKAPIMKFYNGYEMPAFGLGTWKSKPGEVTQAVKDAIDMGYRHIDCAHVYENEKEVGAAIKAKIAEGVIKRQDLFITSKLWNTFHRPDLVEPAAKTTLTNLGLDYLDLYLIHWPVGYKEGNGLFPKNPDNSNAFSNVDYVDTWKAMESLVSKGLVKSIGVSNFNSEQIDRILKNCTIKPATNQIECHPYLTQRKLSEFCKQRGIVVTAYSPLGSPDRPWAKPDEPKLLEDKKLGELAKKYNKTPAQILIRYQLDRGHVVIPKSVTKSRIAENSEVFDFKLTAEDIAYIDSFDCNGRICPLTGLGTWKSQPSEVTQAVKDAIDIGYRHIDCAAVYGNEPEIGAAITEKIKEGVVKRDELFITSKLPCTCHRPELVEPALMKTLNNLGLQSLDLYLVHWPSGFAEGDDIFPKDAEGNILCSDIDYVSTWQAMEGLVKKGLVKNIGVSNFNSKQIERLLAFAKIKPVTNQVECHPYLTQKKLSRFCENRSITITAYSPFASPDRPAALSNEPLVLEDPTIKELATKYKKSSAQIALRYQVQRGHLVIPKSVTKSRIQENMEIFDFEISEEDMDLIDGLNCDRRVCNIITAKHHKYYPFNEEF